MDPLPFGSASWTGVPAKPPVHIWWQDVEAAENDWSMGNHLAQHSGLAGGPVDTAGRLEELRRPRIGPEARAMA